jgi:hypothetical protein
VRLTRSRRLAVAATAVLVLVAAGIAALATREREPARPPVLRSAELDAEDFLDSIGVVGHFQYADTAYGRAAEAVQRLRELGVRHLRDGMPAPGQPLAAGLQAARAAGIRATLVSPEVRRDPAIGVAHSVQIVGAEGIVAFEGPNELDKDGDPDWPAALASHMPALAAAVRERAPAASLIGPSFIDPTSSRARLPRDLPGQLNGHPYPGGGPPEGALGAELRRLPAGALRRGVVFTETGYHNALAAIDGQPPASEEAAATYLPRLLLTAFGAGVRRTFVYELLDEKPDPGLGDAEQHFGLLRNDLSPKPAFTALHRLVRIVRTSPGAGRGPLRWELRPGEPADVRRLTLIRADGSRVLALWRPESIWDERARRPRELRALSVELRFSREADAVAVWRPSLLEQPVLRRRAARRLSLQLGGDLVLVSLR